MPMHEPSYKKMHDYKIVIRKKRKLSATGSHKKFWTLESDSRPLSGIRLEAHLSRPRPSVALRRRQQCPDESTHNEA